MFTSLGPLIYDTLHVQILICIFFKEPVLLLTFQIKKYS